MKKSTLFIMLTAIFLFTSLTAPFSSQASAKDMQVIVGYDNEAGKQAIEKNSKKIHETFSNLNAVSVSVTEQGLKQLKQHSNVSYIEGNIGVEVAAADTSTFHRVREPYLIQEQSWNMQLINAPKAWKENFTGKGVKIAVVDSGISTHADLQVAGGVSTVDYTSDWLDDYGHGTHVAGIIGAKFDQLGVAGVAPNASLYAVKALNSEGEGTLTDFLEAIDWSIQNKMDIINLSLGTTTESQAMKDILAKAYNQGILIVGSSGNNGTDGVIDYPAKFNSVIGVSAVDITQTVSDYSSRGAEVEFSAPGTEVTSSYLRGTFASTSGTSTASPHVAGMLAVLKERFPEKTNVEIRTELQNHVRDYGDPGKDPLYGYGFIHYSVLDVTAPSEVTNAKATDTDEGTIEVSWSKPAEADLRRVNIFYQGQWVASVNAEEAQAYTITDVAAAEQHDFLIQTEDKVGNRSTGVPLAKAAQVPAAGSTAAVDEQPAQEPVPSEEQAEPAVEAASGQPVVLKEETPSPDAAETNQTKEPAAPVVEKPAKEQAEQQAEQPDKELEVTATAKEAQETTQPADTDSATAKQADTVSVGFFQGMINGVITFFYSIVSAIVSLFS